MKTTLDLPDELMRAIKVRAAQQGRKMKDVVTELLRSGLSQTHSGAPIPTPRRVQLPLVHCGGAATREQEMTPERVAAALLDQEAQWWSDTTMLLCDTNIWLALALSGHVHHRASRAWLDTINAPGVIHFCRATQQSLLRLLTNRTVLGAYGSPPLTNREAWAAYAAFLDDDRIVLAGAEPDGLEAQWRAFAVRQSPAPKVWMDAYLAAFALTGGFELVTTDTAFTQYGGIELRLLAK